jgi:hypothetical protein
MKDSPLGNQKRLSGDASWHQKRASYGSPLKVELANNLATDFSVIWHHPGCDAKVTDLQTVFR